VPLPPVLRKLQLRSIPFPGALHGLCPPLQAKLNAVDRLNVGFERHEHRVTRDTRRGHHAMERSSMYVLHYAPDNASLIIRLALEERGLSFTTALVDRDARDQDAPAYLALNPTGQIPVLETPDGPLFETGAILLWLADRHDPAPSAADRLDQLKWLFFLSNTAHAELRQLFYAHLYVPHEAEPAHHARVVLRMHRHFALLEVEVEEKPRLWAAGSVLTPYLCVLMRWSVLYPDGQTPWFDHARYPALAAVAKAYEAVPAAMRAADAEGLGPTPFSAP